MFSTRKDTVNMEHVVGSNQSSLTAEYIGSPAMSMMSFEMSQNNRYVPGRTFTDPSLNWERFMETLEQLSEEIQKTDRKREDGLYSDTMFVCCMECQLLKPEHFLLRDGIIHDSHKGKVDYFGERFPTEDSLCCELCGGKLTAKKSFLICESEINNGKNQRLIEL
jgi:hypothetical protein